MTEPAPQAPEPPAPGGTLQPTPPALLAAWAVVGLALGWLLHPVAERLSGTAPIVSWLQPMALLLVAAILGGTARATWRTVQVRREALLPHQAVNRLVLARACAFAAAPVAGAYLGYALSWLGVDAELAEQRMERSFAAAAAGLLVVVAALLLERACRVPKDPEQHAA